MKKAALMISGFFGFDKRLFYYNSADTYYNG